MKKTYNVMNRAAEPSLVYLVASKCGLVGAVQWGIKVFLFICLFLYLFIFYVYVEASR